MPAPHVAHDLSIEHFAEVFDIALDLDFAVLFEVFRLLFRLLYLVKQQFLPGQVLFFDLSDLFIRVHSLMETLNGLKKSVTDGLIKHLFLFADPEIVEQCLFEFGHFRFFQQSGSVCLGQITLIRVINAHDAQIAGTECLQSRDAEYELRLSIALVDVIDNIVRESLHALFVALLVGLEIVDGIQHEEEALLVLLQFLDEIEVAFTHASQVEEADTGVRMANLMQGDLSVPFGHAVHSRRVNEHNRIFDVCKMHIDVDRHDILHHIILVF